MVALARCGRAAGQLSMEALGTSPAAKLRK